MKSVIVVGAGAFGLSAALELLERGYQVTLLEADKIPSPRAASTDISKVCRMEYGADEFYTGLMAEAFEAWEAWNERALSEGRGLLFHKTGILFLTRADLSERDFERESLKTLEKRGAELRRLDPAVIAERYPQWSAGGFQSGFYHAQAGYAESARVLEEMARWGRERGLRVVERAPVTELLGKNPVTGVKTEDGRVFEAKTVVLACGIWTRVLLPELDESLTVSGHPVLHFRPEPGDAFQPPAFPVFAADVTETGIYGFPLIGDVVKVATHGLGERHPGEASRVIPEPRLREIRSHIEQSLPGLKGAELVESRVCFYCDSQDEDFWICQHLDREGLVIATAGSGHGFKFAPVLGSLIVDALEGVDNPRLERFRWRPELRLDQGREEARSRERE